jgi:putative phosphoribosyl transferase
VVLVDDGIATGATMRAAIAAVRTQEPSRVVVAAPVAPPDTMATLMPLADATVCLATPEPFGAIARFYRDFPQVPDAEVISLLARAWQLPHGVARGSGLLNR